MNRPIKIAPSILAADFGNLSAELGRIADVADMVHVDLMDGHFVPNLSLGMPVVEAIRRHTDLVMDCHLMMSNADLYLEPLKAAGADGVTVHIEAFPEPTAVAQRARELGLGFGLVLNPPTPFAAVEPFVELCDMVLLMSVHPGFGGQSFIDAVLPKVQACREFVDSQALAVDIEIDGGISNVTAPAARAAGANVFVAGSAVYGAPDPKVAIEQLRNSVMGVD